MQGRVCFETSDYACVKIWGSHCQSQAVDGCERVGRAHGAIGLKALRTALLRASLRMLDAFGDLGIEGFALSFLEQAQNLSV